MPNATELVPIADLKSYLQITGSTKDTILTSIKAGIEAAVKRYCDRDFLVTSYVEYYDGDGGIMLRVENRPIVSVTSIYCDPSRLFDAASLIPASDMVTGDTLSDNAGIVRLFMYRFLRGLRSTKITYSAGYATIPDDLQLAVKIIASAVFKTQDKSQWGQISQHTGDMTITLAPDKWPKDAVAILNQHRRMVV